MFAPKRVPRRQRDRDGHGGMLSAADFDAIGRQHRVSVLAGDALQVLHVFPIVWHGRDRPDGELDGGVLRAEEFRGTLILEPVKEPRLSPIGWQVDLELPLFVSIRHRN